MVWCGLFILKVFGLFFYPRLLVPHLVVSDISIFCWKCCVRYRSAQQGILRMNVLILRWWMLSVTHHETTVSLLPSPLLPLGRHATVSTFLLPQCILQAQVNGTRTVPSFNLPIPKQDLKKPFWYTSYMGRVHPKGRQLHISCYESTCWGEERTCAGQGSPRQCLLWGRGAPRRNESERPQM